MSEEELSTIEVDVNDEEKTALVALGIRLALLQAVFDCTYSEIFETVEKSFGHRKVVPKAE